MVSLTMAVESSVAPQGMPSVDFSPDVPLSTTFTSLRASSAAALAWFSSFDSVWMELMPASSETVLLLFFA